MAQFEPKQFGKYYLLEKLAMGGMAEIYKAKTFGVDGFEKLLALKRILPHCSADKDFISMLIDEAKLSVVLSHANIVQVYDLGKVGDDYFISMEYINGANLRDIVYRCREKKIKLPPELAVYMISEICKGLDYAHRKTDQSNRPLNIVHRDVSPQNILISYEGEVKIVDFGIAKAAMNISHTMAGILKGKIAYMSPEQALGKAIDHRTDIFSAGIILYEALTQQKLYTGESQFEVLKKIRTSRFEPQDLPKEIPTQLKTILAKTLAYFPKDRYQSAGDLQTDLTKFLYQTYMDFTPQKLAAFVKELFLSELKSQQAEASRQAALYAQTSSINVAQEALQENIVHRDDTGVTVKAIPQKGGGSLSLRPVWKKRKHTLKRAALITILLAIVAGASASYWKWLHPIWFSKPAVTTGTVSAHSTPSEAKIFIDGQDTGLLTPAILEGLELQKKYSLKLKKDGYADLTHELFVNTTEPIPLNLTLSKEMGTLNITSRPDGAKIFINKEDTGKVTPATISNLELKKEMNIVLTKLDHLNFERSVTIEDANPVNVDAELQKIPYGDIKVTSTPAGGSVYLNGANTGQVTPATLTKLEQNKQYTIRVSKDNYTGFTKTITLDKDEVAIAGELVEKKIEEPATTSLNITSSPAGASIFLNGKDTGRKTPATFADIQVKKNYTVKLEKPQYQGWSKKIYVANATPQNISGTLKELAAPPPVTPTPPVEPVQPPAPPARPEVKVETPPETKPEKKAETKPEFEGEGGTVKINSRPGRADVFVNSERRGQTPVSLKLPPGPATIMVAKDGYMRYTASVSVRAGGTQDLGTIELGELYGSVYINSTPPSATVTLDGRDVGARTPVTIRKVKRDQSHNISVTLDGYRGWSRSFTIENEDEKKFNVILEKE